MSAHCADKHVSNVPDPLAVTRDKQGQEEEKKGCYISDLTRLDGFLCKDAYEEADDHDSAAHHKLTMAIDRCTRLDLVSFSPNANLGFERHTHADDHPSIVRCH